MNAIVRTKTNASLKWCIVTRLVLVFTFVSVFSSCGFLNKNDRPRLDLTKLQIKADIIAFAFRQMPKIYSGLVKLNNEILLIDKELERLKEIESEFPKQKQIIVTEQNNWKKVKVGLEKSLSNIEREVEKIYVTHLVNKDNGIELINNNIESLAGDIDKTLKASRPQTKRLMVVKKKSFIAGLKGRLFG